MGALVRLQSLMDLNTRKIHLFNNVCRFSSTSDALSCPRLGITGLTVCLPSFNIGYLPASA